LIHLALRQDPVEGDGVVGAAVGTVRTEAKVIKLYIAQFTMLSNTQGPIYQNNIRNEKILI
jgi:hypothetical protein